ncbi:MAG: tetratricopeptide repeat protein [Cyanobacteria bacterium J06638_38]
MSHTIGQAKEDNQQSNFNSSQAHQDSPQPESRPLKSNPSLSDADYEFLFNQLLEGMAHGWHDRRIVKFFKQLGDRGRQADWVAWLDRVRPKLLRLPIQSQRQRGTIMIRLGELTQSAPEVNQIGAASLKIGKELLFGNTQSAIWEYDGPDLVVEAVAAPLETEQELSDRLPIDFVAFSSDIVNETQPNLASATVSKSTEINSELPVKPPVTDALESLSEAESNQIVAAERDLFSETESETAELLLKTDPDSSNLPEINNYSEKFEFELEEHQLDQVTTGLTESKSLELTKPVDHSEHSQAKSEPESYVDNQKSQLANAIETWDRQSSNQSSSINDPELDPVAIDMQQVMHLIQEDDELAQQISAKLNSSLAPTSRTEVVNQVGIEPEDGLDKSSIELVESWFNLGLKHVSAGEFDKAIASWEKALKINPNLSEAWHNRGSALGRLGSYEAAVESFQNALDIDPHNYQAWNDRAHALYQLQNWTEAVSSWGNAIKIMPGNHLFWYNRGCALEQLEKWQDAIASYEKVLEIKPDFQPGRSRYINLVADNSRPN